MMPRWWKPPASTSGASFSSPSCSARRWLGLAALMGGAFLSLYPSADAEILVFSLAVVIIGGRGSLVGVGGRQPAGRAAEHTRPGDVSRTGLFRDLWPDGGAVGVPSARPVRTRHMTMPLSPNPSRLAGMTGRAALIAALVVIAAAGAAAGVVQLPGRPRHRRC